MDESWRTRMGMPTPKLTNYPPLRSTGNTASHLRTTIAADDPLSPEDFTDVFGGPPRTIFSPQYSAGGNYPRYSSSGFSYEHNFRHPEKAAPENEGRRQLPQFRIPFEKQRSLNDFYNDIFWWHADDETVVRSRSKMSSSSALSSEELSPLRPEISDDGHGDVSSFGSKLRPINVGSSWISCTRMGHEDYRRPFADDTSNNISEIFGIFGNMKNNNPFGPSRRNASPESISIEPISDNSFLKSADESKFNSPSSPAVSSVFQSDREKKTCKTNVDEELLQQQEEEEDEDEIMCSYVIEFDIGKRSCEESNGVDEAIAWAKEKYFQTYSSEEKPKQEMVNGIELSSEGQIEIFQSVDDKKDEWAAEEETSKVEVEMQIVGEKIRLWSTGKEADIRLLLSSLHHILWSDSGWVAIPLMNIIESSQVKKAYQKAQLCLHPDKMQQRSATFMHKYIAGKVFSVLQGAWGAFISGDA